MIFSIIIIHVLVGWTLIPEIVYFDIIIFNNPIWLKLGTQWTVLIQNVRVMVHVWMAIVFVGPVLLVPTVVWPTLNCINSFQIALATVNTIIIIIRFYNINVMGTYIFFFLSFFLIILSFIVKIMLITLMRVPVLLSLLLSLLSGNMIGVLYALNIIIIIIISYRLHYICLLKN